MQRTAIVCAVVILFVVAAAVPAGAQGGAIVLSSSDVTFDCDFSEVIGALNSIYVIHTLMSQASGSSFKVNDNWTSQGYAVQLGVTFPTGVAGLGDIYSGIALTYSGCKPLPRVIARMDFFSVSPTPPCLQYLDVVPNPMEASGTVVAADCTTPQPQILPALGYRIYINGAIDCPCFVGAEQSTWGKLKSLYQ